MTTPTPSQHSYPSDLGLRDRSRSQAQCPDPATQLLLPLAKISTRAAEYDLHRVAMLGELHLLEQPPDFVEAVPHALHPLRRLSRSACNRAVDGVSCLAMGAFPEGFEPKFPSPEVFDRWVEIAARIESRDPEAVRAFHDATDRVLGWMDVHGAQSGNGLEPLVGCVIQPDLSGPPALSDGQCILLLTAVMSGEVCGSRGETDHALELLSAALDQPRLTDLIYWPKEELEPSAIVELARRHRGTALNPFLDPSAHAAEDTPFPQRRYPPERALSASRALLVRLVEEEAIELHVGESTARELALLEGPVHAEALGAWLESHEGIAEVHASDDELERILDSVARTP